MTVSEPLQKELLELTELLSTNRPVLLRFPPQITLHQQEMTHAERVKVQEKQLTVDRANNSTLSGFTLNQSEPQEEQFETMRAIQF